MTNWTRVNNSRIPSLGTITAELEFGKWKSPNRSLLIVPNNRPSLLGRDNLVGLGVRMQQMNEKFQKDLSQQFSKCIKNVTPLFDSEQIKIAENYAGLVT